MSDITLILGRGLDLNMVWNDYGRIRIVCKRDKTKYQKAGFLIKYDKDICIHVVKRPNSSSMQ